MTQLPADWPWPQSTQSDSEATESPTDAYVAPAATTGTDVPSAPVPEPETGSLALADLLANPSAFLVPDDEENEEEDQPLGLADVQPEGPEIAYDANDLPPWLQDDGGAQDEDEDTSPPSPAQVTPPVHVIDEDEDDEDGDPTWSSGDGDDDSDSDAFDMSSLPAWLRDNEMGGAGGDYDDDEDDDDSFLKEIPGLAELQAQLREQQAPKTKRGPTDLTAERQAQSDARNAQIRQDRMAAAREPIEPAEAKRLAGHGSQYVRADLANNPTCPPDVLAILLFDSSQIVKWAAAGNPATPLDDRISLISQKEDVAAKVIALRHKDLPPEVFARLQDQPEHYAVCFAAAANEQCPTDLRTGLLARVADDIKYQLAAGHGYPDQIYRVLSTCDELHPVLMANEAVPNSIKLMINMGNVADSGF